MRIALLIVLAFSFPASAADPEWKPLVTDLLKSEKTGFGGLCGIVVDHKTGEIFVNLSDRGTFHSTDRGASWKRMSATQPKGRTETPGCWLIDPTGKTNRMVTALVYGAPIGMSVDGGTTWTHMNNKSAHIDWCAVDWSGLKFVLALKHEAGGLLLVSRDGGTSFDEVGKGYGTGWIFDADTAVVAQAKSKNTPKPNLMRTTDAGKTFQPCGEYSPVGVNSAQALPKWHDGTLYWLVDGGLISSSDKGMTWKKLGEPKDALYGPIFGKTSSHMLVLAKGGVIESTDSGATWSKPIVAPKEMKGTQGLSWLEYDPKNDVIYLMKMGSDLYAFSRKK